MNDSEVLVAWLREAADEIEKAHEILDEYGVPRSLPKTTNQATLSARIVLLAHLESKPEVSHPKGRIRSWIPTARFVRSSKELVGLTGLSRFFRGK